MVRFVVYTTKFSKKKAVIAVLILGVVLVSIILLAGSRDPGPFGVLRLSVRGGAGQRGPRVEYLESLGWKVSSEPIDVQSVVIPKDMDSVYKTYNELQKQQGFDLAAYGGMEATRYTYQITNYPDAQGQVVADLVVYRNRVIAGDVQSTALNGFMIPCAFRSKGRTQRHGCRQAAAVRSFYAFSGRCRPRPAWRRFPAERSESPGLVIPHMA